MRHAVRHAVRSGPQEIREPHIHNIHGFISKTHKTIYNELVARKCDIPEDRFTAWMKELGINNLEIDEIDWIESFTTCFSWTQSIQLRSFEYKFRLRALIANNRLFKMGIVESKKCLICNAHVEDLKHLFWECARVNNLWAEVLDWVNKLFETHLDMDPGVILLNMIPTDIEEPPEVVWLIMLVTKKFIWGRRCSGLNCEFNECKKQVLEIEKIESSIAVKNLKRVEHDQKWGMLSSLSV